MSSRLFPLRRTSTAFFLLGIIFCTISAQRIYAVNIDSAVDSVFQQFDIEKAAAASQVPPGKRGARSYTYVTDLKAPQGKNYVVITDMVGLNFQAVEKLANAHNGKIIRLADMRQLTIDSDLKAKLVADLGKVQPEYVALCPKIENFSENVTLALWEVLTAYGNGSINVYPSFLVASDPTAFAALVDRNLSAVPVAPSALNAFIVGQSTVASAGGARAVQKAMVMKSLISKLHGTSNSVVVKTADSIEDLPAQAEPTVTTIDASGKRVFALAPDLQSQLQNSNLFILFGHGSPGMTCTLDVSSFRNIPLNNEIVLCGSCFSATPDYSDIPSLAATANRHSAPFFKRAIANGARVFYGHMHENGGFPEMFVVFEALLNGESIGQGYQRLLNVQLKENSVAAGKFVMSPDQLADNTSINQRNGLLYIMIGDPAAKLISAH
jgi:hypothetical protein